jgi:hypothetical protein
MMWSDPNQTLSSSRRKNCNRLSVVKRLYCPFVRVGDIRSGNAQQQRHFSLLELATFEQGVYVKAELRPHKEFLCLIESEANTLPDPYSYSISAVADFFAMFRSLLCIAVASFHQVDILLGRFLTHPHSFPVLRTWSRKHKPVNTFEKECSSTVTFR